MKPIQGFNITVGFFALAGIVRLLQSGNLGVWPDILLAVAAVIHIGVVFEHHDLLYDRKIKGSLISDVLFILLAYFVAANAFFRLSDALVSGGFQKAYLAIALWFSILSVWHWVSLLASGPEVSVDRKRDIVGFQLLLFALIAGVFALLGWAQIGIVAPLALILPVTLLFVFLDNDLILNQKKVVEEA